MERLVLSLIFLGIVGCNQASPRGFALPEGDAVRGKKVFADLSCAYCHRVAGHDDLPHPTVKIPAPLIGGKQPNVPTDGELVSSIINPQHQVKRSFVMPTTTDGTQTRMPDYNEVLTVAQLVDLATFLRASYQRGFGP